MKKQIFLLTLLCGIFQFVYSQEQQEESVYKVVDSLFREDQFYFSVTYNLIAHRPTDFKQYSFSAGLTTGFVRDFPITKNRNWSIAPGVGYAYNDIKQFINSNEILSSYYGSSENVRARIISHGLDFPFEVRWRNATPTNHKFWRVYAGFKATYLFDATIKIESSTGKEKNNILDDVNRWQYGAYLSFGFNTWNPYIYYGLNPIFKDGSEMRNFNLGFMFYIL